MIIAFISGVVVGAIGFALILKNNKKLQGLFNLITDKAKIAIKENLKKEADRVKQKEEIAKKLEKNG